MSNKLRKLNKKNQSTWGDVIKALLFVGIIIAIGCIYFIIKGFLYKRKK